MAKPIDYPQASLSAALQLAKAVDDLGGRCTTELAADKLNKKIGGGYRSLVGAAAKFGLLKSKGGYLETTHAYKDYKLAYSKEEADKVIQVCLLHPPIFRQIYDRFKGRPLPVGHFEKMLIREFEVNESVSSRVAKYFIDGAKMSGLLGAGGVLLEVGAGLGEVLSDADDAEDDGNHMRGAEGDRGSETPPAEQPRASHHGYTVRISGPGMDSVVAINEEDDLVIVEVMLGKVKRQLNAAKAAEEQ